MIKGELKEYVSVIKREVSESKASLNLGEREKERLF